MSKESSKLNDLPKVTGLPNAKIQTLGLPSSKTYIYIPHLKD